MQANVRGALGTQIFDLAYAVHTSIKTNDPITKINVNTGGKTVSTTKIDWLSQTVIPPAPVKCVNSRSKQGVWDKIDRMQELSNSNIKSYLALCKPVDLNNHTILHVRGIDRQLVDVDTYVKTVLMINDPNIKLLGDDQELCKQIITQSGMGEYIGKDAVTDWYTCIGAKKLYSAFTNFALSAMLFDPHKPYAMIDQSSSNGPGNIHKSVYSAVQCLFDNYFTQSNWIKI